MIEAIAWVEDQPSDHGDERRHGKATTVVIYAKALRIFCAK